MALTQRCKIQVIGDDPGIDHVIAKIREKIGQWITHTSARKKNDWEEGYRLWIFLKVPVDLEEAGNQTKLTVKPNEGGNER